MHKSTMKSELPSLDMVDRNSQ
uniref:Uncharacterized protein n=1 Tax=Ralstonia solanacearum TaxID=305 RepID=A0A0S4V0W1_RALSL|nr:protein of unknown function [Ralstonia solanacearum]